MSSTNNKKVNIIYNGQKIYENISAEHTTELLLSIAEKCYDNEMDFNLVEIEYVR